MVSREKPCIIVSWSWLPTSTVGPRTVPSGSSLVAKTPPTCPEIRFEQRIQNVQNCGKGQVPFPYTSLSFPSGLSRRLIWHPPVLCLASGTGPV